MSSTGKGKKGSNPSKRFKSFKTQIKHELRGVELRVSTLPTSITTKPWFNLVVRIPDSPGTLTIRDVIIALKSQLGFSSLPDSVVGISLQKIKIWGPLVSFQATTALQPISVSFIDFLSPAVSGSAINNNRILQQFTRFPDQVRRATVGYMYPIAHQDLVLTSISSSNNTTLYYSEGLGSGSVVYVYLKWRSSNVASPSLLHHDFELLNTS